MRELMQAIESRHSIRQFADRAITGEVADGLRAFVEQCNRESGLNMQLMLDEPQGLSGIIRRINLRNATNYLAIVGPDDETLDERGGYYGEKVVLKATQLGLGSCWFALGAKRKAVNIASGERMLIIVALGYPAREGKPSASKPLESLYAIEGAGEGGDGDGPGAAPPWFLSGVKAAQLAPTARNQQRFRFTLLKDGRVKAESLGGLFTRIDLGIARYHFEVGAGQENFAWADACPPPLSFAVRLGVPLLTYGDVGLLALIITVVVALVLHNVISVHRDNRRLRRELDERFGQVPVQDARRPFRPDSVSQYWDLRQRHRRAAGRTGSHADDHGGERGGERPSGHAAGHAAGHASGHAAGHADDPIDDRTWDDLDMDRVFVRLNSCLTSVGDKYLYALLHEPRFDEQGIARRERLMAFWEANPAARLEAQFLLSRMGRSDYSGLHLFNYEAAPLLLGHPLVLPALAALPLLCAVVMLVNAPLGLLGVVLASVVNGVIHYRIDRRLELYLGAVSYLGSMLWSTERILRLLRDENVPADLRTDPLVQDLERAYTLFRGIRSPLSGATRKGRLYTEADSLMEFFRIIFLTRARSYNRTVRFLADNIPAFRCLYEGFGEVEVSLSVLSLRMSLPYHTRPVFTKETVVEADGLYHPLLEQPVANSVALTRNSLVSGSNASGKSTFIKALAINGILAQTINTCTATTFRTRPALVVTSMATRDDLLAGESYFIAEIRSLKRLIEHARRRYCLCFVDEILKGTNTVERIAASAAILRHVAGLDSLCLVATHDNELTVLLGSLFENYHFTERVVEGGVSFDYLLRPGPTRSRNAIRLLDALGFDEAMVRDAEALVATYERTGRWLD